MAAVWSAARDDASPVELGRVVYDHPSFFVRPGPITTMRAAVETVERQNSTDRPCMWKRPGYDGDDRHYTCGEINCEEHPRTCRVEPVDPSSRDPAGAWCAFEGVQEIQGPALEELRRSILTKLREGRAPDARETTYMSMFPRSASRLQGEADMRAFADKIQCVGAGGASFHPYSSIVERIEG